MSSIYDWSKSAGSNGNSDTTIAWPEGQTPGSVNNSARAMMAREAEFRDDISGALAASGTANGLVVTANSGFTTLANGRIVAFRATASNTTAANINVNSTGAKSIRVVTAAGDAALAGGEIQSGGTYVLMYNEALNSAAGGWQLINPSIPAFSIAVATRTALKALNTTVFKSAVLMETGYEGLFVFKNGNYSARHADDAEYTYIKADAIATTSGAWVRVSAMRMPDNTLDEQQDAVSSYDPDLFLNHGFPYAWKAAKMTVTANANPSVLPTIYTNYDEWAAELEVYEFYAGFNTDAGDHTLGRSGAWKSHTYIYHRGQGDLANRMTFALLQSNRSGATHFLANPAMIIEGGNIGADADGDGGYLNHSEYIYSDSGYDVAAIDRVRNYLREGNGTSLSQVWIHDRPQSNGTYPVDAAYSVAGKYKVGWDATPADFGANKAAIALKAGDRIYYNASATVDSAGAYWYADTLSNTYSYYDSGATTWVLVVNGQPTLQVKSTDVTIDGDLFISGDSAWTSSSPTPTASGSFTSVACTMRHKKLGRMVFVHASVVITTNGAASSYIAIPIPFAAQGVTMLSAAVVAGGFEPIIARTLGSDIILLDATGAYPGADGLTINVSGVYEATS